MNAPLVDFKISLREGTLKIVILGTILVLSFIFKITYDEALAKTNTKPHRCQLPTGEVLRIACTTECGWFNENALKSAASDLGYEIEILNIYNQEHQIDFSKFDAVVIPGGADIDPKYYIEKVDPVLKSKIEKLDSLVKYSDEGRKRDPFEYKLLDKYFAQDLQKPVLGICRGMQMLSVVQGIPLYVDIEKQLGIDNLMYTIDTIKITKPKSEIAQVMQERKEFWGVQLHHQGLQLEYFEENKNRWPHLKVTAVSNGGKIAEVLEFSNRPVLGVQFHPEYTLGKVRNRIFTWLLTKACEFKQ